MAENEQKEEIILQGVAASPGVSHGPAFVFLQKELEIPLYQVEESKHSEEIQRFEQALLETRTQIAHVRAGVAEKLGEEEAQIFDAHLLVLEDRALIEETIRELEETNCNIEYGFHSVSKRYIEAFDSLDDEYIKERVTDIRDVSRRLLQNLMGQGGFGTITLRHQRVIVSEDLSPSDAASIDKSKVLGVVTDAGSRTSHAVIMARSLGVPAVVGLHDVTQRLESGDIVMVDGYDGVVIINPSEQTLFRYGQLKEERQSIQRIFESSIAHATQTADGKELKLVANISSVEDCPQAIENGAEGVGLFRTEGFFIQGDKFPSEEEQYKEYRAVAEAMAPHTVVIRTLDLGGDKQIGSILINEEEENPFMGFRAIRFCLDHPEIFKDQLRAILRAATIGNVKVMYPMISSVKELIKANQVLEEAKDELRERGVDFYEDLEVGSMIEIPSAALISDLLADYCKFFSIGTNDLIQYLLAVDRVNDRIAHLYEPNHPAVIRTIAQVINAAKAKGVRLSVCGEMAADPIYVPLLFGMGADVISATATSLPEIKYLVRKMKISDAEALAQKVVKMSDPDEIFNVLRQFYLDQIGDVFAKKSEPKESNP